MGGGGLVCSREGVCSGGGCLLPGGSALGGCLLPGGSPHPKGGSPCPETPPVNRITHTCKNITLAPTSLRPVNMHYRNRDFRFNRNVQTSNSSCE